MEVDPIKRDLVPHISEIIATGEFMGEATAHKYHRKFEEFGHYKKMLSVPGDPSKRVAVIVDVGIDALGRHEYNMYNMTARSPVNEKRFDYKERRIREDVRRKRAAKKTSCGLYPLPVRIAAYERRHTRCRMGCQYPYCGMLGYEDRQATARI
ncbi:MAG: hypothetical protein FWH25_04745 [Syntrophorhabdaceae bacterium]|nr:hypothetical protein [Syntrophorhabdaceae bacterium]